MSEQFDIESNDRIGVAAGGNAMPIWAYRGPLGWLRNLLRRWLHDLPEESEAKWAEIDREFPDITEWPQPRQFQAVQERRNVR